MDRVRSILPSAMLAVVLTAVSGCMSLAPVPYGDMVGAIAEGADFDPDALREAWLAQPDVEEQRPRLEELEAEALNLLADEPLRLGAVGSAILDIYFGSLAGHLAMQTFYQRVEAPDDAARHERWGRAVREAIEASAVGTPSDPYQVLSAMEARAFLLANGESPIGSMYVSTDDDPFVLQILARKDEEPPGYRAFDLERFYRRVQADASQQMAGAPGASQRGAAPTRHGEANVSFGVVNLFLAMQRGDSAAQVFVGYSLAREERFEEASTWLVPASKGGNLVATLILAQLHRSEAFTGTDETRDASLEKAEDHYLMAIAAGSDEAMAGLGALYVGGFYGGGMVDEGLELLDSAADKGNTEAMVFLANAYATGQLLDRDYDASERYWVRAADLDDEMAKLQYARFLLADDVEREFNDQAWRWLREVAQEENPEAMLLIASLYARGVHVSRNYQRARLWFRNAVSIAPNDPDIVNEVAWTLTVSHLGKLRDERYALRIMERVMSSSDAARESPAFLDTWAAAHAANGNFDRAIDLQERALEQARRREETTVLAVLEQHLEAFRAGETISENIP